MSSAVETRSVSPAALAELVAGVVVVLMLSRFLDGPAAWAVAGLVLVAVLLGALQLLADQAAPLGAEERQRPASPRRTVATRGIPIESLLDPAVFALGAVGLLRLVPIGLLEIPLVGACAWVLARDLRLEARLAASPTTPSAADRTAVLAVTMAAGLAAFAGIAALVPGGMPDPTAPIETSTSLVLGLAAVDGLVAFLLAYRVAALRSANLRDVGWAASAAALAVAITSAALRTLEIPGLLGPALLVLVFFLWEAMHSGATARRRDPRRIWEAVLLIVLGLVVVAWSLGLRS